MERAKRYLPLGAAGLALVALVLCPDAAAASAREGLRLCANMLVPSLLPFFIVSGLLRLLGLPGALGRLAAPVTERLFGLSGAGASALLLGLTGGYPLGAAALGDLTRDGVLSPEEAERALPYCNNSGPAFLIGAVGTGVFHSRSMGLALYGAHMLAALLLGLLLSPKKGERAHAERVQISTLTLAEALPQAVRGALDAMLTVCGFAVAFAVLTGLLDSWGALGAATTAISTTFGVLPQFCRALLTGLLELSSGVSAMRGLAPTRQNAALAAFLIGFGGVSVHCQTAAVLAGTGVRLRKHFWGRILHGLIAAMLMLVL